MKTKIIVLIIGLSIGFWVIPNAIKLAERNECLQWKEEAQIYTGYYLTDWQQKQCEYYKIEINILGPKITVTTLPEIDQKGIASYYDYSLPDDPNYSKTHATAASTKYKRGTKLQVCSQTKIAGESYSLDDKCVEVIINDHGPDKSIHPDRVIDLSSHAFGQIANLSQGLTYVAIRELK